MKGSYIIAAVAVIVVIILVAAVVLLMNPPPSSNDQENGDGGGGVSTSSVNMVDLQYDPMIITVSAGTTVTWYNNDTVDHTVTTFSGPASFDSGVIRPGETFSFTFTEAGTYDYWCTLHPFMEGQVFVSSSA
jgi:amicyanin